MLRYARIMGSKVTTERLGRWLWPLASGALFAALAVIGLLMSRGTAGIAALWPANAVLLTALIVDRRRDRWLHGLTCATASVFANWFGGTTPALAAAFTVANLTGVGLSFWLLRRRGYGRNIFDSTDGLAWFVASIGCGVPIGGVVAATAIWLAGGAFAEAWLAWTASDLLGMALVTLLALSVVHRRAERGARRLSLLSALPLWPFGMVVAATILVFSQSRFPTLFVPLATVLVVTYRLGVFGAVVGTFIVALIGSTFIALGHGPIALIHGSTALRIQFFQFYLVMVLGTSLPLAALLAERGRMMRDKIESDRRHRRILDQSREVIFETDLKGRWTYLNPAWESLTGRPITGSLGESFLSVIAVEDREAALQRLAPLYERAITECHQDLRYLHADGSTRWASVRSHLLEDTDGVTIGTYGTLHDVTERVAAETALAEREQLYRLLADNSNDMIVRLNSHGVRSYVSPASRTVLGYEPEEMVGNPAAGAIHPDDRAAAIATCRTLLAGAENPICTYRQLRKDGSYVWLEASYRLLRDPATGQPGEFIASVRDVSRRQHAELERAELAARAVETNRLLFMAEEMSGVGHWRLDLASSIAFWSDTVCDIHGRPRGYQPPLETAIEVYHPDDRGMVEAVVTSAIETGQPYQFTARLIRTDGALRHVVSHGRPEVSPDGAVTGLFGVFQDVTDAHDAQAALKAASDDLAAGNRMLTMAEAVAHVGHWRVDNLAGTHFWSDEVYRIHGVDPDFKPTFDNALSAYHPDDRDRVRSTVEAAVAKGAGYSFKARIFRPNGQLVHVFVRGEVDLNDDRDVKGLFGIVQDITEQAEAEALLREREARFRLITEEASDMISVHDVDGRCTFMSPAARTVLGYDPDDILGSTVYDYVAEGDYRAVDAYRDRVRSAGAGGVSTLRVRMRCADGSLRWIEIASRMTQLDGKTCIISVSRDAAKQVAAEEALRDARAEAEAAARAKSTFLANMSHEIRTPMNGVVGFTELLLASDLDAEQRRQTELIADSGRAMMRLLNDILDLSKVEAGQMAIASEPLDVAHALRACAKLVAPAVERKGIEFHCRFDDLPAMILGDGLRLRQIVLNLLGNATKFTDCGSVTLSARPDDGFLRIDVADTGIGIPENRQAAIFEQFVQAETATAAKYGGTGLGLAISSQLARLMGGELTLESEVGVGTRFTVRLPLHLPAELTAEPARTAANDPVASHDAAGDRRILVAEDHDVNQQLITAMLGKLGYAVDIAQNGIEAIALVEGAAQAGRPYPLVLMDVQMPLMDGLTATRRLRDAGFAPARLPVIALTANAYADDIAACSEAGMQAHLAKPYTIDELTEVLRRWSAAAPPPEAQRASSGPKFSLSLQDRFAARKAEALAELDALVRRGTYTDTELADVAETLHKLAGTAGMFGEGALGDEARRLEEGLETWAEADRVARINAAVAAIARAA